MTAKVVVVPTLDAQLGQVELKVRCPFCKKTNLHLLGMLGQRVWGVRLCGQPTCGECYSLEPSPGLLEMEQNTIEMNLNWELMKGVEEYPIYKLGEVVDCVCKKRRGEDNGVEKEDESKSVAFSLAPRKQENEKAVKNSLSAILKKARDLDTLVNILENNTFANK